MSKPNWLIISPTSGAGNGTITNSALPHTGRVQRSGVVTVQGNGISANYTVIQTPKEEFVIYDNSEEITLAKEATEIVLTGKSNSKLLKFSCEEDSSIIPNTFKVNGTTATNGSSINGDPGASEEYSFTLSLSIPENINNTSVTRTIKVVSENGQIAKVLITQAVGIATLTVSPTEITIPADGSSVSVQVKSNTTWEVV